MTAHYNPAHMTPARREVPPDTTDAEIFVQARQACCQMYVDQCIGALQEQTIAMNKEGLLTDAETTAELQEIRDWAQAVRDNSFGNWRAKRNAGRE